MPYTITNSGAVSTLNITKLNATNYRELVNSDSLQEGVLYVVEGAGGSSGGGLSASGGAQVDIATNTTAGIVSVPPANESGLTLNEYGQVALAPEIPIATSFTQDTSFTSGTPATNTTTGTVTIDGGLGVTGNIYSNKTYGAVWNDYAEYRECAISQPGRVVYEVGDDTLDVTDARLQYACSIISDTFGMAIGETEKAKVPIALAGRVLAYPYENREVFRHNIGHFVCSAPNGTVSLMDKEEIANHPEAIIGHVSAVPDYEVWGGPSHEVDVNNRVWIKLK